MFLTIAWMYSFATSQWVVGALLTLHWLLKKKGD